jgi:hypothetical protein
MESETTEWAAMMNRLERLEKQNRRFKQIGALALILAGSVLLMGQAPVTRTVEANEFVLKDSDNKIRARMFLQPLPNAVPFGADKDGPVLTFYDAAGKRRVKIGLEDSRSPGLSVYDEKEEAKASLYAQSDKAALDLYAPESGSFSWLQAGSDGYRLWLRGVDGSELIMDNPQGGPRLYMLDREGFKTTVGTTDLITPRTGETHKTSAASVVMFDREGTVLWKAP